MVDPLAQGVRDGEPRAIARAITLVEEGGPEGLALLAALAGVVGRAHRVGVTGPPGVGKSTLVAALARAWRTAGRRVGIVAVDPTSPFTGGALLGDRVRMGAHFGDPGVFIRSLASRGAQGGVSLATHDVADVLDAGGFDPVVVETVGVGQGEVAIAGVADTVVVVVAPGHGDGVQAMKGGVLEAADLVVVNQADRDGAEGLAAELRAAIELRETGVRPPVLLATATKGTGVEALRDAIDGHRRGLEAPPGDGALRGTGGGADLVGRRASRAEARIRDAVDRARSAAFWSGRAAALAGWVELVVGGRATVAEAASRLVEDPPPAPPRRPPEPRP
ncbi:MAG: methylmalonyl Co-A mutase-associated GTPase MeaB [Planctomycetia bacterium]|nr:methylmalonyl Co-A mutase-associated GTPase MeaB [Planctomycetia bacterium]